MREVFTYVSLEELNKNPHYEELKKYPFMAVSADFRKALFGNANEDKVAGKFAADNIISTDFGRIASGVSKEWGSDQGKFYELILLSELLREKLAKAEGNDKERHWLIGCQRNAYRMLSAIMLLEQAGVEPKDIDVNGDRNLEIMIEAWNYLLEKDPIINDFRKIMKALENKSEWERVFIKEAGLPGADFECIVVVGFYYITPYQERLFRLLEKAGYKLIFLIHYDERFPYTYKIWDNSYATKMGFAEKKDWNIERSAKKDPIGDMFEGNTFSIDNKLEIREHASVVEFINEMKRYKDDGYITYSSNFTEANRLLKDFYPEDYGERKVLSYPIGQFVSTLNQMWDDDLHTVVLEEDKLIECFSSGWLAVGSKSGKQYLQDLIYILPFFNGCKTIDKWEKRIKDLKDIMDNAVASFSYKKDAEDKIARWQDAIGNPLTNFSPFAVEEDRLEIVITLIRQLLAMASALFEKNEPIHIKDHITKLDKVLKAHEMSNELYEEEKGIVQDIFNQLAETTGFKVKCFPADISRALNVFMYGKFEEGEIQSNRVGLVKPLYQIDASIVKSKKVHLCMCDVNSMPGGNKAYIWPLSRETVQSVLDRTGNTLILNLIEIMESNALCNRYFMHETFQNKEISISWISEMNEKLLAPSPYIKLLCEETGISIRQPFRKYISNEMVDEIEAGTGKIVEYDKKKVPNKLIKEARMAYALCPMKYVLGYVLEKHPVYQSEFHQSYALNALIVAIYNLMKDDGITIEDAYDNVIKLFPGLRSVEKRQVMDYISYNRSDKDMDNGMRSEFGNRFYTDERLKIHYPHTAVRDGANQAYGMLNTPDGRSGLDLNATPGVEGACEFCQHISYCKNARYRVDKEELYD